MLKQAKLTWLNTYIDFQENEKMSQFIMTLNQIVQVLGVFLPFGKKDVNLRGMKSLK